MISSSDPNAKECSHLTNPGAVYPAIRGTSIVIGCLAVSYPATKQCQSRGLTEGALKSPHEGTRPNQYYYGSLFKQCIAAVKN